jgi:hypothetical protein
MNSKTAFNANNSRQVFKSGQETLSPKQCERSGSARFHSPHEPKAKVRTYTVTVKDGGLRLSSHPRKIQTK